MFHGTAANDPKQIAATAEGLDLRFARDGAAGVGIYFADNSAYSLNYGFATP